MDPFAETPPQPPRHCFKCGGVDLPYGFLVHTECLNTTEPLEYGHCYCCGDKTNSRYNIFCSKHSPPKHENPLPIDELLKLVRLAVCCRCEGRVITGINRTSGGIEKCAECKKNCNSCGARLAMVWMSSCEDCHERNQRNRQALLDQADETGLCFRCHKDPIVGGNHTCRSCKNEMNRKQRETRNSKKK